MLDKILSIKKWLLGLGVTGIVLWYVVKVLICAFAGICII